MKNFQQRKTRTTRRLARLMGGASIAVLVAYGPAMAQVVNITLDASETEDAFTAANVTGFDTTANNTQESRATVVATIDDGGLTAGIAEPDEVGDPASGDSLVGIADNRFEATARGNVFSLEAQNLGNDEDGRLGILTGQFADGQVRTSIANTELSITAAGEANGSAMDASDNTLAARTTINQATTIFADDVAANLADQFAQSGDSFSTADSPITLTRGNFEDELLSTEGGDSVVASTQTVAGAGLTSEALVTDSEISIALSNEPGEDNDDAEDSALSVTGNALTATLAGNVAVTGTDLDVDTDVDGAAGVFSQQQIGDGQDGSGDVELRAAVTGSSLTIDLDSSTDSALTVSENRLGAQARGNVATLDGNGLNGDNNEGTFLRVEANQIAGTGLNDTPGDATAGTVTIDTGGTLVFDDGGDAGTGFDFVAATQQSVASETGGFITAQNTDTSLTVTAADTTGNLSGSSLSVEDNTFFALAGANTGGTALELEATSVTASAGVANDQNVADTDVNAFLGATTFDSDDNTFTGDAVALSAAIDGAVTNSSVALDGNLSVSEAMGNVGRTDLQVTATTIDRSDSVDGEGSTNLALPAFNASADFASLNVQNQTGNITALNQTTAGVTIGAAIGDEDDGSSVSVSENVLQADAMSNTGTNRIALNGSAGITETTTALGSVQVSGDPVPEGGDFDNIDVTAALGGDLNIDVTGGLVESSAAIDGNQGFASAGSNRVTNEISLTGNAISGGDGTTLASVGVTLLPQTSQQVDADTGLSSLQLSVADVSTSSSLSADVSIGEDGISSSSASVSENFSRAFAMGNEGVNRLGINADTSFDGAAALAGSQVQIGDVTGSSDVTASISTENGGALDASSATIDENIAFSRVMGNDQTNALSIEAITISGVSAADDNAEIANLGGALADTRDFDGDNVLANAQSLVGDVTGSANVQGTVTIEDDITNSSASLSENIAQSNVTGNRGVNTLSLEAATSVTGVSVLASEQLGRDGGASNEISSEATLSFTADQDAGTTVTSSALNVDGNLGVSSAFGNDVTNRLSASGTTVVGQDDALSVAGISDTGVVTGTADTLLGNFQGRVGEQEVNSEATLTVDLLGTSTTVGTADSLGTSSVSVRDNLLDSTATSNRARNTLALNADTALTAGGALVNSQVSDSPVNSDVRLRASVGGLDTADQPILGDVTGSSIALRDNTGIARASGNDAVNVLNARGGTGITGVTGAGEATLDDDGGTATPGVLNASGTFAMASNQVNTGAVQARAGFGNAGDGDESLLEARTGALTGSSVAIGGNRLVADAVSNRVENRLTVNGSPSSQDVTTAITSRQIATGPVTAQVNGTRLASVNGAVSSSSVGLNGNTLSASAGGNVATSRLIRD